MAMFTFNNITTGTGLTEPEITEPETVEAVMILSLAATLTPLILIKRIGAVAILTTDNLDALTVDLSTIIFAGANPVKWESRI